MLFNLKVISYKFNNRFDSARNVSNIREKENEKTNSYKNTQL